MKIKKGILIPLIIIVLIIGAAVIIGAAKDNKQEIEGAVVEKIKNKEVLISKYGTRGVVEAKNEISIFTEVPMKVSDIYFNTGDAVTAGEIIVSFNKDGADEITRSIKKAEINIRNAELNLEGLQQPETENSVERAEEEVAELESDIKENKLILRNIQSESEKLKIDEKTAIEALEGKKRLLEAGAVSIKEIKEAEEKVREIAERIAIKEIEKEKNELSLSRLTGKKEFAVKNIENLRKERKKKENEKRIAEEKQKNEIEAIKIEIEDYKEKLKKYKKTIAAPFDGVITSLNIVKNGVTSPSEAVLKIADISRYKIIAGIPEYYAPVLKNGQRVLITGEALKNKKIEGKIERISEIANEKKGSNYSEKVIETEITFNGKNNEVKIGNTLDVEIITGELANVPVVPIYSLMKDNDKDYVFVVNEKNEVKKRFVTLGIQSDIEAEVVFGLKKGEEIISNPNETMAEGMLIKREAEEGKENDKGKQTK